MSRGDCGDLLKLSVICTAYKQTQALLLKVVGCGYLGLALSRLDCTKGGPVLRLLT